MGNPLKYWRVFRTLSIEVLCVLAWMEDTGPVFTRIIYWPWNWANWFRYFQYFRWSNQTFLSRKDFRPHSGSQAAGLEQIKVWGHSVPDRRSSCCWPGGGRRDFFFFMSTHFLVCDKIGRRHKRHSSVWLFINLALILIWPCQVGVIGRAAGEFTELLDTTFQEVWRSCLIAVWSVYVNNFDSEKKYMFLRRPCLCLIYFVFTDRNHMFNLNICYFAAAVALPSTPDR